MSDEMDVFDELVRAVAEETGRSEEFCRQFITRMGGGIRDELEAGQPVSIEGLGEFHLESESDEVVFEPDPELRDLVNAPYAHMEPEFLEQTEGKSEPDTDPQETEARQSEPSEAAPASKGATAETVTAHEPSISFKNKYRREQTSQSHLWIIAAAFIILLLAAGAWYLIGILPESTSEPTDAARSETTQQTTAAQDAQELSESASEAESASASEDQESEASDSDNGADQGSQAQAGATTTANQPGRSSQLRTVTVRAGQTLWGMADNEYQNPYLWPWIYDTNQEEIEDPDVIYVGQALDLPLRSGADNSLSDSDSLHVALAYVETYRWYKENKLDNAKFYLYAAVKYHAGVFDYTNAEIDDADRRFANRAR